MAFWVAHPCNPESISFSSEVNCIFAIPSHLFLS
jgi:hypothetical protein